MEKQHQSQFHLFREKRFLPFFLTQFCGALNDNLFKNALLVIIVSTGVSMSGVAPNTLTNLAAGLFILPFFLFSATAGQLADKYDKARLIRYIKLAEILIMLTGSYALYTGSGWLMFVVLFAMGAQSAFFGPIKYSIIPQHLRADELLAGNAQVEMGTFVSILLGTLIGGWVITFEQGASYISVFVIAVALTGWLCSRQIPQAPAVVPDLKVGLNPIRETINNLRFARESQVVFYSVLGVSWFWLYGAAFLTQVPNFAVSVLQGQPTLIAVLLCAFIVGVASGSLLCDRLSGQKVEPGLTPFGAFGLSVFGIDLFFSSLAYGGPVGATPWQFLVAPGGIRIFLDLMLIGMFGGFYIVPLYALVQMRTDESKRARVIAANNILNAMFMVLSSVLGIVFLSVVELSIAEFFLVIALMNMAVATFVFYQVPEFSMRFLIWLLSHSMYRVTHTDIDSIPEEGPAVIVCNHVSYVDALILAGAVRRPIRFVMHKSIFNIPVLRFIFKTGRSIPICSPAEGKEIYKSAMDEIADGLKQGDLICIFPEGKLTRDGEIATFRRGVERVIGRTPVPVIPMALRGLWGSFFSHSGYGAFKTPFWRIWSKVEIVGSEPIEPQAVTAENLQEKVAELRGDIR